MKQSTLRPALWFAMIVMVIIIAILTGGCAGILKCKCEATAGEDCTAVAECTEEREIVEPTAIKKNPKSQKGNNRLPEGIERDP